MSVIDSVSDVQLKAATCPFSSQCGKSGVMTTDNIHRNSDQESVLHEI